MKNSQLSSQPQSLFQIFREEVLTPDNPDADFMTDVNAVTLQGASRSSYIILWVAMAFIITALIWSSFATLDEVTKGEGKIIPSRKVQVIQNLEGGILTELLDKEGDIVQIDQPILRLDDTRFASNFQETRMAYLALLSKAARLKAEINDQEFLPPPEVVKEKNELANNEQQLYLSRKRELESNINVLMQQKAQRQQELTEIRAKKEQAERGYALMNEEMRMSAPLVKEGVVSEVEYIRLKRSTNELRGELDAARLAIPRVQSSLEEVEQKIKEAGITFKNKATSEYNDTQAELSKMSENIRGLEDRVTRTLVKSPVRGTVKQIKISTIGGVVQPGSDLAEIVPLEDSLLVEANIRPADIAFLRPGQSAMVKFTAYDFSIYGGLTAKLELISADSITNEKGESFFLIHVRTDKNYLLKGKEKLVIIPGMTAQVDILTGEKTVLNYLLKPILKAQHQALRER